MRLPLAIHEEGGKERGFRLFPLPLVVAVVVVVVALAAVTVTISCAPMLLLRLRDEGVFGVSVPDDRLEGDSSTGKDEGVEMWALSPNSNFAGRVSDDLERIQLLGCLLVPGLLPGPLSLPAAAMSFPTADARSAGGGGHV